ncbi:MAG: hypothetical protein JSS30_00960 [Verrucomicrobia bacterium]|nr:hypothetical protein [Verrucomicrobiota bacterium]
MESFELLYRRPSDFAELQIEIVNTLNKNYFFSFQLEKNLDSKMLNPVAFPIGEMDEIGHPGNDLVFPFQSLFHWSNSLRIPRLHCLVNHDHSGHLLKETDILDLIAKDSLEEGYLLRSFLLCDWQMAKKTISGLMIQHPKSDERFLVYIRPGELLALTVADKIDKKKEPELSNISLFSPIDEEGKQSVGSWKGKAIAVSNVFFQPDQSSFQDSNFADRKALYTQGIRKYSDILGSFSFDSHKASRLWIQDNLTVMEFDQSEISADLEKIRSCLKITGDCLGVFSVIKRDKGFHPLASILDLPTDSVEIAVINFSALPQDYNDFVISNHEEFEGFPLIRLIQLTPKDALVVDGKHLDHLSLTSCEEFIFRKKMMDAPPLKDRIHTETLFIVYKKVNHAI